MGCKGLGDDTSTPIDISRTELPKWVGSDGEPPVLWVAVKLVVVVGLGNASIIPEVLGVSESKEVLKRAMGSEWRAIIIPGRVIR
jgi:hypothetical protein